MTNDLFDVIGTPQQRQERLIRTGLESRRDNWSRDNGEIYRGSADLLLQHGKFYSGRQLPEEYEHLKGPVGRCFENTLDACKANPELRYCEGVYDIGDRPPTPHAWALDPEGNLLELTLPTDPETIARFRRGLNLPVLSFEHWGYFGAVFHPEFVAAVFEDQEGAGLLDRPNSDLLDRNPDTAEWREDWIVLHLPYNPDRRTLESV